MEQCPSGEAKLILHPISPTHIFILSSYLYQGQSVSFFQVYQQKLPYTYFNAAMRATCHSLFILVTNSQLQCPFTSTLFYQTQIFSVFLVNKHLQCLFFLQRNKPSFTPIQRNQYESLIKKMVNFQFRRTVNGNFCNSAHLEKDINVAHFNVSVFPDASV